MTRLFDAGFVERFRPQTLRGSYQQTYGLAREGSRAAERTGELSPALKFAPHRRACLARTGPRAAERDRSGVKWRAAALEARGRRGRARPS
jgi:hypothetical protein